MRPQRWFTGAFVLVAGTSILLVEPAHANSLGITGRSGKQGFTCTDCHRGGLAPLVEFIGPSTVAPGEMATFRFEVGSMIPTQSAAGFNVAASGGQLDIAFEQGGRRVGDELTHNAPKTNQGLTAGWDFTWTAPDTPGTFTLYGAGNSVNRNGIDTGDLSATTTLEVVVAEATATPTATPIVPTATTTPTFAPQPCVGDCDGSGTVGINELITGVNVALGHLPLTTCSDFDVNASETVEINELIAAVSSTLFGCI